MFRDQLAILTELAITESGTLFGNLGLLPEFVKGFLGLLSEVEIVGFG